MRGLGPGQLSEAAAHLLCDAQAALHRPGGLALDGQVHGASTAPHRAPATVEQGQSDAKLLADLQAAERSLLLRPCTSSALVSSGSTQQGPSARSGGEGGGALAEERQAVHSSLHVQAGAAKHDWPTEEDMHARQCWACLDQLLLAAVQRPGSCHPAGVLARV